MTTATERRVMTGRSLFHNLKPLRYRVRRTPGMTACPICYVRHDAPITPAEAEAVIEISAKMGDPLEAWKCQRVPGRVHLVVPPESHTEPGA
jgi:hypothetical protein